MAEAVRRAMKLRVISPSRVALSADAVSVAVPAYDGLLGVLPGHAPFVALLGAGRMTARDAGGSEKTLAVRGGFLQVTRDEVVVLTPQAASAADLSADALRLERERLAAEKPSTLDARGKLADDLLWVKIRESLLRPPQETLG